MISELCGINIPISFSCRYFGITRSHYYQWIKKPLTIRFRTKKEVCDAISKAFEASGKTYGSPRIHAELRSLGVSVSENTVAKYMRELGLDARYKKKFKPQTTDSDHSSPIAERLFRVEDQTTLPKAPREMLAGDITYLKVNDGYVYLAVVLDVFTREVVGWSMSQSLQTKIVIDALGMAMKTTGPDVEVMFHSDRGSQYASEAYRRFMDNHSVVPSMSRRGNCYDNSYVESWFASLKKECVYRKQYSSETQLRALVFKYIETWYNSRRRHSSLNYMTPLGFRESFATAR